MLAAAVAFVGAIARQDGVPRWRTVWAEDGALFGQCPLIDPNPASCLLMPYDGWLHFVPRSLAWIAASLPLDAFSYVVTALAALVLATCAFLVARAVAEASGSSIAGAAAGVALALVYPAGAEVAGNITNLAWVLFVAATTVLACGVVGRRLGRLDVVLVLATLSSTPFGFLLVAILAIELRMGAGAAGGRALLGVAVAASVAQLAMAFVSPRNELPNATVTLLSPVGWFFELYFRGPFGGRGPVPGWAVGVGATVVVGFLLWRALHAVRPAADSEPVSEWAPLAAVVLLGVATAAVFGASTYLNRHDAARYDYVLAAGLTIGFVLAVAFALPRTRGVVVIAKRDVSAQLVGVGVVAIALGVAFATTFRVTTPASRGPSYPGALREAAIACDGGATVARVTISPLPAGSVTTIWTMRVPCSRL